MHNFIMNTFNFLRSFLHFMKIIFMFCILMLLCYWVQNLTSASWTWLGFITPFLDGLLDVANSIYSVSFNVFGTVFEFKYLSAVIILVLSVYAMKLLQMGVNILEGIYTSAHYVCKKTEEFAMNQSFKADLRKQEKKISSYIVVVNTKLKKKFSHEELNINIDEQNQIARHFVEEKTGIKASLYNGGFKLQFTNFDNIDNVLDILFKLINSNTPLSFAISIQAGDNIEQLDKLIDLKHFDKITMAADTAYRYSYNDTHRYSTTQVGLFQYNNKTLEVHEFKEIL